MERHGRRMSSAYRMIDDVEDKDNWSMSFTYKMKRSGQELSLEECQIGQ